MQNELIRQEIEAAAAAGNILFENQKFVVVHAYANDLIHTLPEIGKLREINFRLVGEGTGKEIDLDRFDNFYMHIIAWNKKTSTISGACRIGEIAKLFEEHGVHGIYNRQEFKFDFPLIQQLQKTVELSRLFVNATGQRNYFGLYLIFCGVSNWMAKSLYYTHLLGSVSISQNILPDVHSLIIAFCRNNFFDHNLAKNITAFKPAEFTLSTSLMDQFEIENPTTFDELDSFIERHLHLKNQVPILFKKYHLFKAHYIAFGIDDDFSSVTDPLIHVSFLDSSEKVLRKFIDPKLIEPYLNYLGKLK